MRIRVRLLVLIDWPVKRWKKKMRSLVWANKSDLLISETVLQTYRLFLEGITAGYSILDIRLLNSSDAWATISPPIGLLEAWLASPLRKRTPHPSKNWSITGYRGKMNLLHPFPILNAVLCFPHNSACLRQSKEKWAIGDKLNHLLAIIIKDTHSSLFPPFFNNKFFIKTIPNVLCYHKMLPLI